MASRTDATAKAHRVRVQRRTLSPDEWGAIRKRLHQYRQRGGQRASIARLGVDALADALPKLFAEAQSMIDWTRQEHRPSKVWWAQHEISEARVVAVRRQIEQCRTGLAEVSAALLLAGEDHADAVETLDTASAWLACAGDILANPAPGDISPRRRGQPVNVVAHAVAMTVGRYVVDETGTLPPLKPTAYFAWLVTTLTRAIEHPDARVIRKLPPLKRSHLQPAVSALEAMRQRRKGRDAARQEQEARRKEREAAWTEWDQRRAEGTEWTEKKAKKAQRERRQAMASARKQLKGKKKATRRTMFTDEIGRRFGEDQS